MIARHGAEARKRAIPFGPFLALGGVVGLLAGNELVDWYLARSPSAPGLFRKLGNCRAKGLRPFCRLKEGRRARECVCDPAMRLKRQKTESVAASTSRPAASRRPRSWQRLRAGSHGAIEPLEPGVFREGEVVDPDRLADALKSLFATHKLSKRVRLGVGNQRVVVRTLRLPAIEDPKEMEAAVRFQAQEQMPMPLDQAVLEHQVVGGVPAEEGSAPQVDVVVVAARRDMVTSFLEPIRRAGLEPVGVDLSAFGMIRALADVDAGRAERAAVGQRPSERGPLLQRRRRHEPRGGARPLLPLHPRLRTPASRRSPAGSPPSAASAPNTRRSGSPHVGLEQPARGRSRATPRSSPRLAAALEEGVASLVDELRLSLDYYGAQESAVPVERIVLCGAGSAIPGLVERMEAQLGLPIVIVAPGRPVRARRRARRPA